jgi:hypothetical protein
MPIKLKELKNMLNSLAARLKDIGFKFPFKKYSKLQMSQFLTSVTVSKCDHLV